MQDYRPHHVGGAMEERITPHILEKLREIRTQAMLEFTAAAGTTEQTGLSHTHTVTEE